MRLLLDTHAILWWFLDDPHLGRIAERELENPDHEVFVSAASAWEIATKYRIGKLPAATQLAPSFLSMVGEEGFLPLSVTLRHGHLAGSFAGAHKDPFDRMLIAQALIEGLTLVSNEAAFDAYGVMRLW
ncbi:MAG: type II toxin-antitoxin system VapC family toxin [Pseudomonadota bacterium]|nr:type II toxin-antitoxin system VapC family toxin [Pseudomonadota bacterium]